MQNNPSAIMTGSGGSEGAIDRGVRWIGPVPPPSERVETKTSWPQNYTEVGLAKFWSFAQKYGGTDPWRRYVESDSEKETGIFYELVQEGTGEWHPFHERHLTRNQEDEWLEYNQQLPSLAASTSVNHKGVIPQYYRDGVIGVRTTEEDFVPADGQWGKIYLNVGGALSKIPAIFADLAVRMKVEGIDAYIKMPCEVVDETYKGDPRMPFRADNLVVHFGGKDSGKMIKVLEGIYNHYQDLFQGNPVPLFSLPLVFPRAVGGVGVSGIAFAQEGIGGSFSQIRAKILAAVYRSIGNVDLSKVTQDGVRNIFRNECQKFKVDPLNPAFNVRSPDNPQPKPRAFHEFLSSTRPYAPTWIL